MGVALYPGYAAEEVAVLETADGSGLGFALVVAAAVGPVAEPALGPAVPVAAVDACFLGVLVEQQLAV